MIYNTAIIGAGLIGRKRANALKIFRNCRLVVTADINKDAADNLAGKFGGEVETNWKKVVIRNDVNIVIVSTINKFLAAISIAALKNGKHVLVEKPLGCNPGESRKIWETAKKYSLILKTGFNHRHHPAISAAKKLFDRGGIGDLFFIRCRYGHGGRPGYEKEWRADRNLCGGGELLDQGVHVLDLFRWFAGNFDRVFGFISTYFWKMEVEDNAFAIFKKDNGVTASMHTSWTHWKNIFSFEIFGSKGYLTVEGLGGSYGTETLKFGRRRPEGGIPEERVTEYKGIDLSWEEEWKEFISAIENNRQPLGNGWDGYQANKMVEAVYKSASTGKVLKLKD